MSAGQGANFVVGGDFGVEAQIFKVFGDDGRLDFHTLLASAPFATKNKVSTVSVVFLLPKYFVKSGKLALLYLWYIKRTCSFTHFALDRHVIPLLRPHYLLPISACLVADSCLSKVWPATARSQRLGSAQSFSSVP